MKLLHIYRKILKESNYKKIGGGNWGTVFEKNNQIYKLTDDEDEIVISKRLHKINKELKHFPKIYSLKKSGKNEFDEDKYIIVKHKYRLINDVPEFNNIVLLIKKYDKEIRAHIANQKNDLPSEVKENITLNKTIKGIIDEFSVLNLPGYNFLDFHINNLGVDNENNIVIFDF
jgi:hypothetical protein